MSIGATPINDYIEEKLQWWKKENSRLAEAARNAEIRASNVADKLETLNDALAALCDGAIENHCTNLCGNGSGCEEYGHPVEQWCGVCLFAHDARALLSEGEERKP